MEEQMGLLRLAEERERDAVTQLQHAETRIKQLEGQLDISHNEVQKVCHSGESRSTFRQVTVLNPELHD
jgi:flagellar biosynthesis chaperone FliJ